MADMVKVRSMTDSTVSLYDPTIPINKVWTKRGAIVPIEREKLIQLYYSTELQAALNCGLLAIDDKNFLYEVGYISDPDEFINTIELTPALMKRCISAMPVAELKNTIKTLSKPQVAELAEYAITNHNDLRMDRIDLLSKASGKDILKAIELYKKAQED